MLASWRYGLRDRQTQLLKSLQTAHYTDEELFGGRRGIAMPSNVKATANHVDCFQCTVHPPPHVKTLVCALQNGKWEGLATGFGTVSMLMVYLSQDPEQVLPPGASDELNAGEARPNDASTWIVFNSRCLFKVLRNGCDSVEISLPYFSALRLSRVFLLMLVLCSTTI